MTGAGGGRVGEPQVFDSLTVSCRGCGRAIPPGEVFSRHPIPDDHRADLTAPFCQACRPIRPQLVAAPDPASTGDLLAALRSRLETQARADSPTQL